MEKPVFPDGEYGSEFRECIKGMMEEFMLCIAPLEGNFRYNSINTMSNTVKTITSLMEDVLKLATFEIYQLKLLSSYLKMIMWEDGDDPSPSTKHKLIDAGFLSNFVSSDGRHLNGVSINGFKVIRVLEKTNYLELREKIGECPIACIFRKHYLPEFMNRKLFINARHLPLYNEETLVTIYGWMYQDVFGTTD